MEGYMIKGSIKRVMKDRGYGFIKVEDGREIFFHMSALQEVDFNGLVEGDPVECDVEKDRYNRGFKAVIVKRTSG
jgi:CspA family cold shock protein